MSETQSTDRQLFPEKLAKQVRAQFSQFSNTDWSGFTVQRTKSSFQGAKTDLAVYNPEGKLVIHGRDFGDRTFFWQP